MIENIFDTHAHYDDEKFDGDRQEVIAKIFSSGVCAVINCGCDVQSSQKSVLLAKEYDKFYCAVGIHPHSAEEEQDLLPQIYEMSKENKVVAIGEIGLDYHYDFSDREIQKAVFEKQIVFANENDIPVIVHSREATADTLAILKKYKPKGVVHCFTGSVETAKEILQLGMYIGIGGAITFKNAVKPVEAAKYIPLERILLETDCPYMSPVPFRGKRNDSSLIEYTAKKLAQIKNIDVEQIANVTKQNAKDLFKEVKQ